MKKKLLFSLAVGLLMLSLFGCAAASERSDGDHDAQASQASEPSVSIPVHTAAGQPKVENVSSADETKPANTQTESLKIKLLFQNTEAVVRLYDNKSSRDLLSMLPLTLTFEDYNSTEKICTLPRELTTENQPDGFTPVAGDFAYYAPWGNLSIFYRDFRYSERLISLGFFESGLDAMAAANSDFTVTIEQVTNE